MERIFRYVKLGRCRKPNRIILIPPFPRQVLDENFDYASYIDDYISYRNEKPRGFFQDFAEEREKFLNEYIDEKLYHNKGKTNFIKNLNEKFFYSGDNDKDEFLEDYSKAIFKLQKQFERMWLKYKDNEMFMNTLNELVTEAMKEVANKYWQSHIQYDEMCSKEKSKKENSVIPKDKSIVLVSKDDKLNSNSTIEKKDVTDDSSEEISAEQLELLAQKERRIEDFRNGKIKWQDMPIEEVAANFKSLTLPQRKAFVKLVHYLDASYGNSEYFIPDDFEKYSYRQLYDINHEVEPSRKGGKKR